MSAHKFAVGEVCLLFPSAPEWRHMAGAEVTILETPRPDRVRWPRDYRVEGPGIPAGWAPERLLRKKPPKEDDGRTVSSWDKCLFKPQRAST